MIDTVARPLRLEHAVEHLHADGSSYPMEMAAQARDRPISAVGGLAAWEVPFICPLDGVRVSVAGTLDLAGLASPRTLPPPATIAREDMRTMASFHLAALNHGLFIAPRGLLALSTGVADELLNEVCERAAKAMIDTAQAAA